MAVQSWRHLLSFALYGSLWLKQFNALPLLGPGGGNSGMKPRQQSQRSVAFQRMVAARHNGSALAAVGMEEGNSIEQDEAIRSLSKEWNITLTAAETRKLQIRMSPRVLKTLQNMSLLQFSEKVGHISNAHRKQLLLRHPILLAQALSASNVSSFQEVLYHRLELTTPNEKRRLVRNHRVNKWSRSGVQRFFNVMSQYFAQDDIRCMVMKAPQVMNYGSDKIQVTIRYLYEELGLTPLEVTGMLRTCPLLVSYSVNNKLRPMIQFIQKELSATEWKRIVVKYPQVLQIAIPKLQEQLIRLEQDIVRPPEPVLPHDMQYDNGELQLQPPQAAPFGVRHMCALYPPLLWLSPTLLQTKVRFFQTQLHMNRTELQIMITCFPQVLGLSIEDNLRPKLTFLLQHMTMGTLKEWILYQPSLVAYSLDKRIRPRVAMLQEHDIALCYSPPYLMSLPDTKFLAWVDMHRTTWTITAT